MSAIQKELCDVTEISPKRGENRQDFIVRLMTGINGLSDKEWDGLSQEAQDWFNDAADAKNAKKTTLPDFPDLKADEPAPTSRRGSTAKDEPSSASSEVEVKAGDLKEGMALNITTKRGKKATGHVVEVTDELVAIKQGDGEEVEFAFDRIETMTTLAEAKAGRRKGGEDEDAAEDPIKVGVEVTVVTKRGKEVTGKIVELDNEAIVLDVNGKDEEFDRSRVESIKPVKAAAKDEPKTSRRGAAAKDEAPAEGKGKRASNEGVSIGTRIKELIADDMEATEADIAKALKKEGLEFRENTLKLNYVDCHKFLTILKDRKLIKK